MNEPVLNQCALSLAAITVEQIIGLYNYWIVIFLMMTGFYIVIARENLIKTVIGLNIFQTSVFLLYITMGKVHGGTAPIIKNPQPHSEHGDGHGAGQGHGAVHGVPGQSHGPTESHGAGSVHDPGEAHESHDRSAIEFSTGDFTADQLEQASFPSGFDASQLDSDVATASFESALLDTASAAATTEGAAVAEAYQGVVYSHPLPSVLMLTAIVVGIATTALALALIVRIREEYGTIEEDEILALDRNS